MAKDKHRPIYDYGSRRCSSHAQYTEFQAGEFDDGVNPQYEYFTQHEAA